MSAPTGAVIVALPADDDPVHALADDAHVTLAFLGEAADLDDEERADLAELLGLLADNLSYFPAEISGSGTLGDDEQPVLLVQSGPLTQIHDLLASEPVIAEIVARTEQFPSWIPHVSIADATTTTMETIQIVGVGLWLAGEKITFPLAGRTASRPSVVTDEDEYVTEHAATLAASGGVSFSCPAVTDERSLAVAVKYADSHPPARPFVIKGAASLRLVDRLPGWPEVEHVTVHLDRRALKITASGFADASSGEPYRPTPPSRRQRRQQAVDRPIADAAELLIGIRREPANPARRRELVEIARKFDRVDWVPDAWPEKPYPLAPGAAVVIRHDARSWERP